MKELNPKLCSNSLNFFSHYSSVNFLSLIKEFSCFAVDLQVLLISRWKFEFLSKVQEFKSSANILDLIVWLSVINKIFVRLDFLLSKMISGNLSEFVVISHFENKSMALFFSDSAVSINLSPQTNKALSSANLWMKCVAKKTN